jgi:hypothetical protein
MHDLVENVQINVVSVSEQGRTTKRNFMRRGDKGIAKIKMMSGRVAVDKTLFSAFVLRNH